MFISFWFSLFFLIYVLKLPFFFLSYFFIIFFSEEYNLFQIENMFLIIKSIYKIDLELYNYKSTLTNKPQHTYTNIPLNQSGMITNTKIVLELIK